jgi:hypothetical protein
MPIDKDFYKLNESYVQTNQGKPPLTKLRPPTSLNTLKKNTGTTPANSIKRGGMSNIDVKGNEAEVGFASFPAPSLNREEDENTELAHHEIIAMLKKALTALEKHAKATEKEDS